MPILKTVFSRGVVAISALANRFAPGRQCRTSNAKGREYHPPALDYSPDRLDATRLAEECVDLFDELVRMQNHLDREAREVVEFVLSQLHERLERSGVGTIWGDTNYDPRRHVAHDEPNAVMGDVILNTLRPGFAVEGRTLRRAQVGLKRQT